MTAYNAETGDYHGYAKKSVIGERQSAKKALVAKRVSADTPKAEQIKTLFYLRDAKKKKR